MPKQKVLSAKDIIAYLKSVGFELVSQKGSHIKLVRADNSGLGRHILVIPNHTTLATGTQKAIINQARKFLDEQEILTLFYTEN